jgi:hypothetical protein
MTSSDGIDSRTQVPVVRSVWVPVAMSHRARHSVSPTPEDPDPTALPGTKKPSGATARGLGMF